MATEAINRNRMNRKKCNMPAKMAARNVDIRPVGAWVQPESRNVHHPLEAVVSFQKTICLFIDRCCLYFDKYDSRSKHVDPVLCHYSMPK